MTLTIGVPKETEAGERRVALVPDMARRLVGEELNVLIEQGAGEGAYHEDAAYKKGGAEVVRREEAFGADVVLKVQPPSEEEIGLLREGQVVAGFMQPLDRPEIAQRLAERGVTALAMELVPRISRAQKMDALSAMASLAGYRAVILAAHALPKFFPLLTTAAGTIRPASALILGAGVAGLQAIATARRLGARVSAYDIRAAVQEEVESLGATFVELDLDTSRSQDAGGYAKALMKEKQERQTELLLPFVANADLIITTAQIPGRPAPLLVTEEAVAGMKPGSVIVDLAAPNGGNCALTEPGAAAFSPGGVQILGPLNLPSEMAVHASQMYARTVSALVQAFIQDGRFTPDFDDEVFRGACLTHEGEVKNERVRGLLGEAAGANQPPAGRPSPQ